MKTASLQQHMNPYLKVVNKTNSIKKELKKQLVNRIYINTLVPNFSYTDRNGETVTPKNCALL